MFFLISGVSGAMGISLIGYWIFISRFYVGMYLVFSVITLHLVLSFVMILVKLIKRTFYAFDLL